MAYERKSGGGKKPFGAKRDGAGGGRKSFGDKKPGGFKKSFGDKPKRSFSDRPKRDFDDKPKRSFGEKKSFGDRPKRDFEDRPRRDFDDKPKRSFSEKKSFGDRSKRDFDDRPRRDFGDKPKRSFGDRPARRDFDDKPKRSFGEKHSFGDRPKRDFDDRPKRDFGDRPPRREYSSDRPKRDFGDKPRGFKKDFGDRPKRDFAEKKSYGPRKDYKSDRENGRRRMEERDERGFGADMEGHEQVFYGIHAVQAALRNPNRTVKKIWVTDRGQEHLDAAFDETRHPQPELIDKRDMERKMPEGAVHQGIAVALEPLPEIFLSDILNAARLPDAGRHIVVVLDEVTDPHNVGAVLRSMSVFGAKAMIVHKRNAPGVTAVMAKIATGAVEHVPLLPVVNLAGALEELKGAGFFCLGLDENADYAIGDVPVDQHIALVMGAEGDGLREKTRATCDAIANIPTFGDIKSLNVSNAAAIALYVAATKKD